MGFFNWNRSYELAKSGEWDASATWLTTSNVERDFLLSPPIHETSFVFFHLSNKSINWNDFEHLSGLHIGLTRGYEYGEEFHQAIKSFNLTAEVVTTDEQNWQKLLKGRIDIFPNDPIVGMNQLNASFSKETNQITYHPKTFSRSSLHLIVSKQTTHSDYFINKFNAGYKKLIKSNEYQIMLNNLHQGRYNKPLQPKVQSWMK